MTHLADNPLLSMGPDIPFDQIRAEHVEPGLRALLAEAQARLTALVEDARPRSYETTLLALEQATDRLELGLEVVEHLEGVATDGALRAAYNAIQPAVSE